MKKYLTIFLLIVTISFCINAKCYDDTNCMLEYNGKTYDCDWVSTDGITSCCHTADDYLWCVPGTWEDECEAW